MSNFGEILRDLRVSKNLTQPQLAELVGVSKGMISFWENNVNEPKLSNIKTLCLIFDVSADYLLGLSES